VHLKAKLEVAEYSEAELREAESREMRHLVREILRANPEERLIVLGDFNDTKNEKTIREILGKPDWPDSIRALPLRDERGEFWTEYWSGADVYSRIDYMMISRKLETEIDPTRSGIARPPFWNEASDHCPLYLTIRQSRPTP
jgi:endonuclease/exonuclease/phosphatase family metal-dependent hydrolase